MATPEADRDRGVDRIGNPRPPAGSRIAAFGIAALLCAMPAGLAAQTLRVGPTREIRTIGAALAAAAEGDTLRVDAGVYRERLTIERAVVVIGEGDPVVDAGGDGHVVEVFAPLTLRGFTLRNSGTSPDEEHAGVMVRGAPARIVDNRIEDVLYGVYLKDAGGSIVRENRIQGKPLALPRRGDGIRLWYSSRSRVVGNQVNRTRDLVVYFSDSLVVSDNLVTNGRYGLHYMYSDHNRFERNRFVGNQVGAFIMYSRDIELRENVFAEAAGVSGMGLGLKDADEIRAVDNLIVDNATGVYLDNSPSSALVTNRFDRNAIVFNQTGVRLLPSVRDNEFAGNDFVANLRPAEVSGGAGRGQAGQNRWRGNYWSGYAGFDEDEDGVGDTPYVHARLADDLLSRHPEFRLFSFSPALRLVDALSHFFPLLRPEPVVVDSAPRLVQASLPRWRESPPVAPLREQEDPSRSLGLLWASLFGLSVAALWAGRRFDR